MAMGRSVMSLSRNHHHHHHHHHHFIKSLVACGRTCRNNKLLTNFNEGEIETGTLNFLVKRDCRKTDTCYFSLLSSKSWDTRHEFRSTNFRKSVSGDCDGLLHMYDKFDGNDLLWTPSTNEFTFLPPSNLPRLPHASWISFGSRGFGFDSKSGDYKVLRFVTHSFQNHKFDSQIELYSLKNDSWKQISEIPQSLKSPIKKESFSSWAYVHGRYFWHTHEDFPHKMSLISFDFSSEKFSRVTIPPEIGKWESSEMEYNCKPVEFQGKLGVIIFPYYKWNHEMLLELWVLQEEDGSWTRVFEISLDDVRWPLSYLHSSDNGGFLFLLGFDDELMVFDLRMGELKKLGIYGSDLEVFPYLPSPPSSWVCA